MERVFRTLPVFDEDGSVTGKRAMLVAPRYLPQAVFDIGLKVSPYMNVVHLPDGRVYRRLRGQMLPTDFGMGYSSEPLVEAWELIASGDAK